MDAYDAQLEKIVSGLQTLPRKLSEENVRMLGNLNHFETFEEEGESLGQPGKRLSLSGSIVVLDLDFTAANRVEKASVSLSQDTATNSVCSPMSPANDPSQRLLRALGEPRLDAFANMLSFLSRCDRFSTKNVDCFRSLDLISESIHWYVEKTGTSAFGKLVMNPPHRLGLGFLYNELYSGPQFAYLDILPGSRPEFCLRSFASVEDWVDTAAIKLRDQVPVPEKEARAEMVLTLDPPVVISAELATELCALISNGKPALDERKRAASMNVRRHYRFASAECRSDEFEVIVGNMLPFQLVEVNQIPIRGPAHIPKVLAMLRQYSWLHSLVNSVLQGPEPVLSNEAADINIADALELANQPVHRKTIPLAIAMRSDAPDSLSLDISWVVSNLQMRVVLDGSGSAPSVDFAPSQPAKLNVGDLMRLLQKGNLALALSYALSSSGRLRRRSTKSFSG